MSKHLVCILAAGVGTRMGKEYAQIHKALLPYRGKAILSHAIELFSGSDFVIAVSHLESQIRDYLAAAHPTESIALVRIKKATGPGSGPGQSLLECAPWLTRPFYFVPADGVWTKPLPSQNGNFLGVAPISAKESPSYCNVILDANTVAEFRDKQMSARADSFAFTGMAFIQDHRDFFENLSKPSPLTDELQVSQGLKALKKISAQIVDWNDLGTQRLYLQALASNSPFDFSKPDESLYFCGNRVIKFFADFRIAANRVKRAQTSALFPRIIFHRGQFYAYEWQEGKTLYEELTPKKLTSFLDFLSVHFWQRQGNLNLIEDCKRFYRDKTTERLKKAQEKKFVSSAPKIQEREYPTLESLLEKVPWSSLYQGIPSLIHGDLQPDNVLCTESGFTLLDWRQDFAGRTDCGDLYYDLAKMRGGLVLHYGQIKRGDFSYSETRDQITYRIPLYPHQSELLQTYDSWIKTQGYDLSRIKMLMGLIFTNMIPMHHRPFSQILTALARENLYDALD